MSDETSRLEEVTRLLEDARLAYGTALIDDDPRMIECVNRDAFEDEDAAEMGLATAYASINADLIPFVMEQQEEFTAVESTDDGERLTGFEAAVDTLGDARAYYFLVELGDGEWRRVRSVVPDRFDGNGVVETADAGRFVVSKTLVDEARERIGDLPDSVDGQEIGVIDW